MYQALYRKYRPKIFADVVGQDHITTTLKNEIKLGRIAHAYLFTGTRGTGKTTCAKIFAKAVNCENTHDGEPCGECDICIGIENESILDVVEMDAASNSGVANMREIIEDIRRSPMVARRKVYIIDEVHALSNDAFTALLKTLEEPPTDTVFILATTEVHKLSATILSRCQRFDFRRVSTETITDVLSRICEKQGIGYERDAVFEVARLGDGSVRDSLSILERCLSVGENLTREHVLDIVGMVGDDTLMKFMDCFRKKSLTEALSILEKAYSDGKDIALMCERLIWMCRCVLVAKSGKDGEKLISDTQSNSESIIAFSKNVKLTDVLEWSEILSETLDRLPRSKSHRIMFEMCLIRLCEKQLSSDSDSLAMRVAKLEDALSSGEFTVSRVNVQAEPIITPKAVPQKAERVFESEPVSIKEASTFEMPKEHTEIVAEPEIIEHNVQEVQREAPINEAIPAESDDDGVPFGRFSKLVMAVMEEDPLVGGFLKSAEAYSYKTHIEIMCPNSFDADMLKDEKKLIEKAAEKLMGRKVKIEITSGKPKPVRRDAPIEESAPDPLDTLDEYDEESNISFDEF